MARIFPKLLPTRTLTVHCKRLQATKGLICFSNYQNFNLSKVWSAQSENHGSKFNPAKRRLLAHYNQLSTKLKYIGLALERPHPLTYFYVKMRFVCCQFLLFFILTSSRRSICDHWSCWAGNPSILRRTTQE